MNPCFNLIKSLSKAEKRYVAIELKKGKSTGSILKLYDALSSMEKFDESLLIASVEIGDRSKLSLALNRLHGRILRAMKHYHENSSPLEQLLGMMAEIEFLFSKHLYDQCLKHIRKARKIAHSVDDDLILLRLVYWESILSKEQGVFLEQSRSNLEAVYNEEVELLDSYKRFALFKYHVLDLLLLSRNRIGPIGTEHLKEYEEILDNPEFQVADEELNRPQKLFLFNVKAMYHFALGEVAQSGKYFRKVIDLIESNPNPAGRHLNEYFMALNNHAITQVYQGRFKQSLKSLAGIRDRFEDNPVFSRDLFAITKCYEVGVRCSMEQYNLVVEDIPNISAGLEKYEVNPVSRHLYYYNIAVAAFWTGNYALCNRWLNTLLNDYHERRDQAVSNLHYYANILSLITQYESGKQDLLEYAAPSTIKFLNKIRPLNTFENAVLRFLNQTTPTINSPTMAREVFNKFLIDHAESFSSREGRFAHQFFDFEKWFAEKAGK